MRNQIRPTWFVPLRRCESVPAPTISGSICGHHLSCSQDPNNTPGTVLCVDGDRMPPLPTGTYVAHVDGGTLAYLFPTPSPFTSRLTRETPKVLFSPVNGVIPRGASASVRPGHFSSKMYGLPMPGPGGGLLTRPSAPPSGDSPGGFIEMIRYSRSAGPHPRASDSNVKWPSKTKT